MPRLSLALLLLAIPPQDMLAPAHRPRIERTRATDPRDMWIAYLEAEVASLRQQLARQRADTPGEWRPFAPNPAYEVYGRDVNGQFLYIAHRLRQ